MARSGAIHPDAIKLNPEDGHFEQRMRQLTAQARRRALMVLLPPGRVLDQAMLDDITRDGGAVGPRGVVRQLLAEAGARTIGAGLILSAAEVEQLEDFMRRNPQGSSIDASRDAALARRAAVAR